MSDFASPYQRPEIPLFRSLTIENFKCIGDVQEIPLAPITLIFGPNSGGKSTIIQSLLLLKQSLSEDYNPSFSDLLRMQGPLANLGSFNAAVHKHDIERSIALSVRIEALTRSIKNMGREMRLQDGSRSPEGELISMGICFRFGLLAPRDAVPQLTQVEYAVGKAQPLIFAFKRLTKPSARTSRGKKYPAFDGVSEEAEEPRFQFAKRGAAAAALDRLFESNEVRNIVGPIRYDERLEAASKLAFNEERSLEAAGSISLQLRGLGRPVVQVEDTRGSRVARLEQDSVASTLDALLRGVSDIAGRQFRQMSYLGPLRSPPERYYLRSASFRGTVGARGENLVSALVDGSANDRRRREHELNDWLRRLGIGYRITIRVLRDDVAGDFHVMELNDLNRGIPVAPSDIGFGFSQLLPIVVEGLIAPYPAWGPKGVGHVICVEQPEIHLHPKLQAEFSDFLIETSSIAQERKNASSINRRRVQWIVESHSEALMLRLQRRIREQIINPDDVCVLYVQPTGEGESKVLRLRLDEDGDFIDEWPGGFFEEAYREKFASR